MKKQILKAASEYAKVLKVDGMSKDENRLAIVFYMMGIDCALDGEGHDDNFKKDILDKIFKITINEMIDEYTLKEELLETWERTVIKRNV